MRNWRAARFLGPAARLARVAWVALVLVPLGAACSSVEPSSTFAAGDAGIDASAPVPSFEAGGDAPRACKGLECQVADCGAGPKTTVSGKVYDPAGKNPLFNVIVYVPNEKPAPLPSGIACDKCGVVASGSPVVSALSGADGSFVLEDAPAGNDIPLVLQIGKWRRQITIPRVTRCQDNPLTDVDQTRLPRNQHEGDLPHIAVVTGGCDVFECLLRNIGVDDAEITDPSGPGKIHVYAGAGGSPISGSTPQATALWSDAARLATYDLVINSCECGEEAQEKPVSSLQNMFDYASRGGRVFATHYQYYFINHGPPAFQSTANWYASEPSGNAAAVANVNTSFPKGKAFADWLMATGASGAYAQLDVDSARYDAMSENAPSLKWLSASFTDAQTKSSGEALLHYTFNTPVGAPADAQCGKVLFSDFHVIEGVGAAGPPFPAECASITSMTGQQKALEFMLFDLSSCIQPDSDPPKPPPPPR